MIATNNITINPNLFDTQCVDLLELFGFNKIIKSYKQYKIEQTLKKINKNYALLIGLYKNTFINIASSNTLFTELEKIYVPVLLEDLTSIIKNAEFLLENVDERNNKKLYDNLENLYYLLISVKYIISIKANEKVFSILGGFDKNYLQSKEFNIIDFGKDIKKLKGI